MAYRPVLFYIDTTRYLYHADGNDPVGYRVPLKADHLLAGNLNTVAAVQHLLGLAMAVAIYLVLIRRGVPRWLAALAAAPVLLDAYQLQIEQTMMPDVWFEALIITGLALLLWRRDAPVWPSRPGAYRARRLGHGPAGRRDPDPARPGGRAPGDPRLAPRAAPAPPLRRPRSPRRSSATWHLARPSPGTSGCRTPG